MQTGLSKRVEKAMERRIIIAMTKLYSAAIVLAAVGVAIMPTEFASDLLVAILGILDRSDSPYLNVYQELIVTITLLLTCTYTLLALVTLSVLPWMTMNRKPTVVCLVVASPMYVGAYLLAVQGCWWTRTYWPGDSIALLTALVSECVPSYFAVWVGYFTAMSLKGE